MSELPPSTDFETTLRQHIAREQIVLLVKGMKTATASSVIAPLLMVWLFYDFVEPVFLWFPALWIYALHIERYFLLRRFAVAGAHSSFEPERWSRQLTWRLGVMGGSLALWTLTAVLTGNETVIFYSVTIASVTVAGALTQFCIYPPALWAFVTPYLLGVALQLICLRQPSTVVIAFFMVVLWLTLILASKRFSKVMHSDIEQRFRNRMLVQELRLEKTRAEAASAAKTRFLAAASHDLRQPVHAVALLSTALQDNLSGRPLDATSADLLARLQCGVTQFADVVDEILDLARFDASDEPVQLQTVPLQAILERIDSTYRGVATGKGLGLMIRPAADPGACVLADAALLWRVLSNLVSNAVRHTARGHILVAVRRDARFAFSQASGQGRSPPGWRIEVRDTGPGIAASQQTLVFEEFYQLHNPQRDARHGLGLGLAVAQRMAASMGLTIDLRSSDGKGAVFSVAVQAVQPALYTLPATVNMPGAQLKGLQALVVDDDASSGQAMADLLRGWGLHVALAHSAKGAFECCQRLVASGQPPQLLLTDHWLAAGENSQHVVNAVCQALAGDLESTEVVCYDKNSCSRPNDKDKIPPSLMVAVLTGDISPATQHSIAALGWHFAHKPVRPLALRMWLENELATCATTKDST